MFTKFNLARCAAGAAAALALLLAGCDNGSTVNPPTPGGGGGPTPPPTTTGTVTGTIGPSGGSLDLVTAHCGTYTFTFPANALSAATGVTITEIAQSSLPAPLVRTRHPAFTQGAGNTFVCAFSLNLNGASLADAVALTAHSASTSAPAGTLFNLAYYQNSTWNDIGTATVNSSGGFATNLPSFTLPGIVKAGDYLVYQPPAGGGGVANFGIAMFVDDNSTVQVVHLYDANGNALAAPTLSTIDFANASDLDGMALTPDGSLGIVVDGSNNLDFITGTNLGTPTASSATIDVSSYGAGTDGDSVAIMPNGDEAVVSADGNNNLLLVSQLLSGSPKAAETIPVPGDREAVVISADGKVLLARTYSSLTAFSIAGVTPFAGPLGGTVSHSFTQTADLTILGSDSYDAREGMAISPTDSSRAVVVGNGPAIDLITGLPGSPSVLSRTVRVPQYTGMHHTRKSERTRHPATAVGTGTYAYGVTISPDGKYAYVATDTGIAVFSGVDTGSLTQVQSYQVPVGGSGNLSEIYSIGITLDGKYLFAVGNDPVNASTDDGVLIPISAGQLGTPVGTVSGLTNPYLDTMVMH